MLGSSALLICNWYTAEGPILTVAAHKILLEHYFCVPLNRLSNQLDKANWRSRQGKQDMVTWQSLLQRVAIA
jgi:hypothetical protein